MEEELRLSADRNKKRFLRIRILALLVGLMPVLIGELALRLAGLPRRLAAVDPYVDLHGLKPLFELDSSAQYRIGSQRMNLFRPASFAKKKPQGVYRVFALGGSTTQGEPYSTETAFGKWLEINLSLAMPSRDVEVINCGGLSYASYRVLAILNEVLGYEPDLIVVYTGQNEYLEKRTYSDFAEDDPRMAPARRALESFRIVQLLRSWIVGPAERQSPGEGNKTKMASEVDALLDYQGGLEQYSRGSSWSDSVVKHFEWNLSQMVWRCRDESVPAVFISPVTNLLDCPPIKFEMSPKLGPNEASTFERHWDSAKKLAGVDPEQAMVETLSALRIDPGHAGSLYLLGRLQFQSGDYNGARESLMAARDWDVCPLRATSEISEAFHRVMALTNSAILDADALFSAKSKHGIVGENWLIDHIHPSVDGHQLLGERLLQVVIEEGFVRPEYQDWKRDSASAYQLHLASLGEDYFHRGQQRLEGLILWTQGRAKKIRPTQ